ncbi:regulator [Gammaproteobacteria bacterium]|nr:regulator [Gammaproteobacteria bacterium]
MHTKSLIGLVVVVIALTAVAVPLGFNKRIEIQTTGNQQAIAASPQIGSASEATSTNAVAATASPLAQQNSKFTHFRVGNRNVKSIFAETDKVWVGTSGGVIRYLPDSDEYRLFDVRDGLLANGVFHVSRWTENKLLVGTYGGGLADYDEIEDKFKIFNVPQGLADAFVYDVLVMPDGDLWIATWSGANRVRGGHLDDPAAWETYTVKNTSSGLPNDWVYGLELGKNGEVWLATEGGLARFKDGKWSNWNHKDGQGAPYNEVRSDNTFDRDPGTMSSHHAQQKIEMGLEDVDTAYNPNYIVALEVDRNGIVWVGTWGGGLARFDGERYINYTVSDGLPSNHVFMLHEDHKGNLWVGTSNGLARFDDEKFSDRLTTQQGLFSNTVFSMDTQDEGILWVGSFGGVARIKL